jgi:hypothetical protein
VLSEYGDLHHGKYDSALCHYVAEAHDGNIVGSAQTWEASDVDVDYYAIIGRKRIYHVDSRGFQYLWRYANAEETAAAFAELTAHLHDDDDEEEGEEPDTCLNTVDGHWYVVTYGRAPFTIHARNCPTCEAETRTTCATCGESIVRVHERHESFWRSEEDGDALSYTPTLHNHAPEEDQ